MISIYTRTNNFLKIEFWKWLGKKILRKYSGPDAVLDSLKRGLTELKIPFEVNPLKTKYKIIHVLSGPEILRNVIREKNETQTLVVGPNVVLTPLDYNGLINEAKINIVLTPSDWVRNFYISLLPSISSKIYSWPAGVKIPQKNSDMTGKIIVFKKEISEIVFEQVISALKSVNIDYKIMEYGKFSHNEYLVELRRTPLVVYLGGSESQGLALQEAWAYNVPTLVYQNSKWKHDKYEWLDPKISAPYLTDDSGYFFTSDKLGEALEKIKVRPINPRQYCLDNLSDKKSAQLFLDIIEKHYEKTN
jgi:hypothetical protein